ncbi:hypothetical protein [Corallococcus caeni]|uniref:Uncharacterized protein n=1 Tax=Corallococcus caeni TaxID=3082388 RepID=A0ABQ6QQ66_9BACT|nr:hypothetical protein ASNO1_24120 [Corallococcus sp. NO1]
MDSLIHVFAVVAAFAMVHERVLELIRASLKLFEKWAGTRKVIDALTIGSFNWVSGVILALVTHADLLNLVGLSTDAFFDKYMKATWESYFTGAEREPLIPHLLGCTLMGFSTTVGAKFWHDAVNGLMDLRKYLNSVGADARKLTAAELKQALDTAADAVGRSRATDPAQALADVAGALKHAANSATEARSGR